MLRSVSRSAAVARRFSTCSQISAASVFRMPAMSPTMTEGGIVSWKYKSGDSYAAGDVLLEVETDKATIDVEATDDGILWEVILQDGATGVPVGKPIALLAEPGDDLSSLEKPRLEEEPASLPKEKQSQAPAQKQIEKSSEPKPEKPRSEIAPSSSNIDSKLIGKANAALKVTPAVEVLLHRNGISNDEALAKIPASGPKGRLLKGDVLAYLGKIEASAVSRVAEYIKNKEHLDLSNIKIAPPQNPTKAEAGDSASTAPEKPKPQNILAIEFTSELGEGVSKDKFQYAFERALESAKRQTYGSRFPNYARSPSRSSLYEESIFDDLLVAPVTKSRFEVSNITYKFIGATSTKAPAVGFDAFDELLGLSSTTAPVFSESSDSVSAIVNFQIKYDEKLVDSKNFVEYFQDALLSQIPSKQLIIQQ